MTPADNREWLYRFDECLGIWCQGVEPTQEQLKAASREAHAAIKKLNDH